MFCMVSGSDIGSDASDERGRLPEVLRAARLPRTTDQGSILAARAPRTTKTNFVSDSADNHNRMSVSGPQDCLLDPRIAWCLELQVQTTRIQETSTWLASSAVVASETRAKITSKINIHRSDDWACHWDISTPQKNQK